MRPVLLISAFLLTMFSGLITLQAQHYETSSSLQPGYWTFGINAGKSYQSSDVWAQSKGYGMGLTLGKNLYYQPGSLLNFDLRSRLFYGRSFGLDPIRSYQIEHNSALNGAYQLQYLQYPEATGVSKGFVFQNHRTDLAELGLEGVITLNRLREQTGLKISLYGGAGLDWYNVKIDQAGADGQEYYEEYAQLNDRAPTKQVLKNLRSAILDGDYETLADDFDGGLGKMKFMPSVGAEIGFAVTPKFSIDFGHRMTFSGTDLLDGHQWKEDGNDLHHYTYAGLNFNINKQEKKYLPPLIQIEQPRNNPFTTRDPNAAIYATIKNVDRASDVDLTINGQPAPFHFEKGRFRGNGLLRPGQNDILISASNIAGTDRKQVLIYLENRVEIPPPPPARYAPVVDITHPASRTIEVETDRTQIEAIVRYVRSDRDIELLVNGNRRAFDFDQHRERLSATVDLWEGENKIIVHAVNADGSDADEVQIIYKRVQNRPMVDITQPNSRFETAQPTVHVTATVRFIEHVRDLSMTVNGRHFDQFDYQYDRLTANVRLLEGNNTIRVRAINDAGEASDEVVVFYKKSPVERRLPVVDIVTPEDHTTVHGKTIQLIAEIRNVSQSRDITVTLGNRQIQDFSFSQGRMKANLSLIEGDNYIRVKAVNSDGSDEQTVVVRYTAPVSHTPKPPVVSIVEPADRSTVSHAQVKFFGKVTQIDRVDQVELTLNGVAVRDFSFVHGAVSAQLNLGKGSNHIRLRATNSDGSDEKTIAVNYQPKVQKPLVEIGQPRNNSTVDMNSVELSATVRHINDSRHITVRVNGVTQAFDFFVKQDLVKGTIQLKKGVNTIEVTAQNEAGAATDKAVVRYELPIVVKDEKTPSDPNPTPAPPKPVITIEGITQPVIDPMNPLRARSFVTAKIEHVNSRQNIESILNGLKVTDFQFDVNSGAFSVTIFLQSGDNLFVLRATNSAGSAEVTHTISLGTPGGEKEPVNGNTSTNTSTPKQPSKSGIPGGKSGGDNKSGQAGANTD